MRRHESERERGRGHGETKRQIDDLKRKNYVYVKIILLYVSNYIRRTIHNLHLPENLNPKTNT
jgi:hypothetical protein